MQSVLSAERTWIIVLQCSQEISFISNPEFIFYTSSSQSFGTSTSAAAGCGPFRTGWTTSLSTGWGDVACCCAGFATIALQLPASPGLTVGRVGVVVGINGAGDQRDGCRKSASLPKFVGAGGGATKMLERSGVGTRVSMRRMSWTLRNRRDDQLGDRRIGKQLTFAAVPGQ